MRRFWRDRFKPFWLDYGWFVVGGVAVLAFLLGVGGFQRQPEAPGQETGFWDSVYHALQLFWLEYGSITEPSNWELDVARILAGVVTFYAAVRAVSAIFAEQLHAQRARWKRNHVVVCGVGRGGSLVVKGYRAQGHKVVAIERDPTNPAIRAARDLGAVVLIGDATDKRFLRKTRLQKAAELVVFCGDDALNAEITIAAEELVAGTRDVPLRAYIQIVDAELRDLLEEERLGARAQDFRPSFFNAAERGAPTLLDEHSAFDREGKAADGSAPHLLVVGVGEMGANAIVHAALRWRQIPGPKEKLPVTIVDLEAKDRIGVLGRRYVRLPEVCDLNPIDMDVRSPEFANGDFLHMERSLLDRLVPDRDGRGPVTTAYVCLDDDGRGLTTALALRRLDELHDVPIVVRLTQLAGVSRLIERQPGLETFGVLEHTCTPEVLRKGKDEMLARAIHAGYLARKLAAGEALGSRPAIVPWEELPEHYRESNRQQADDIRVKLEAAGATLVRKTDWDEPVETIPADDVEEMAQKEHDRWYEERKGMKGEAGQDNPNLVPWGELTPEQQEVDRAMIRDLPGLLADVGYRIER